MREHRVASSGFAEALGDFNSSPVRPVCAGEFAHQGEGVQVDHGDSEIAVVATAARCQQGCRLLVEAVAVEQAGERLEVLVQDVGVDERDRGPAGERDEHPTSSTAETAKARSIVPNSIPRTTNVTPVANQVMASHQAV